MKYGYEFLESDTEIYNLLVRKQRAGDEILNLFSIQYINDNYAERDAEEVNTIYVLRDEMVNDDKITTFDGDGFTTKVQLIINTSQYNSIKASAILKTAVHTIKKYLELDVLRPYTRLNKVVPTYVNPGRLSQYRMELLCYEINELEEYSSHDYKTWLKIKAGITGENEGIFEELFPIQQKSKLLPVPIKHETKIKNDDFGGG